MVEEKYSIQRYWMGFRSGELWRTLAAAKAQGQDLVYRRHSMLCWNGYLLGYIVRIGNVYWFQGLECGDKIVPNLRAAFENEENLASVKQKVALAKEKREQRKVISGRAETGSRN